MTSGNFAIIPLDSIIVNRDERQRRVLSGIEELAASIAARGLINPLTVDRNHVLIAGERRYTACRSLGLTEVSVQYVEDLSDFDRKMIELEENVKRVDLDWKDYVTTVAELHKLNQTVKPDWSMDETAQIIGMSKSTVSNALLVSRNLEHELVKNADKLSVAVNAASRYEERKATSAKHYIEEIIADVLPKQPAVAGAPPAPLYIPPKAEIINGNFVDFVNEYTGEPFNFLHCDFPYGVNTGDKSGQSAAKVLGSYEDSAEIYFNLLGVLGRGTNIVSNSAHLVFWFSMDYYSVTRTALEAAGWTVNPFPLIWHKSDNTGMLPDPNRGPRRTYETAFFASRGNRKVVKAVANSYGGPSINELHTSEKPRAMLTHFLRMVVDDTTRMLDPTAGSGNAVRVSSELGAAYALGLELNPEFAEVARANVQRKS